MECDYYQDGGSHRFKQSYRCFRFPAEKSHLESGGKIIMPVSAIYCINALQIEYPMQFEMENSTTGRASHCGVLEFTAEEGLIYMPQWMMKNMEVINGELVKVKSIKLKKETCMKLQPRSKEFIELSNPKAVLESTLRKFSCLSIGDTIKINNNDKEFYNNILETKLYNAVSIIGTDCEVDFAPPLDYKEPEKESNLDDSKHETLNNVQEEPKEVPKFRPFMGVGRRVDGKPSSTGLAITADCSSMVENNPQTVTKKARKGDLTNSGSCRKQGKLLFGSNVVKSPNLSTEVSGNKEAVCSKKEEKKFQPFTGKKYTLRDS